MKFLVLGFLVLSVQIAFAGNTPTKLNLQSLDSKFITVKSSDQAVVFKNIESALKEISGGPLALPDTIGLIIPQTYASPFFDPMALTLVAPYQMVIDGKSKNPVFTRAVELHEFGHAIFNENMELVLKQEPNYLRVWRNAKKIITKTASIKTKILKKNLLLEMLASKIEETKASATSPIVTEFETLKNSLQAEEEELKRAYIDGQRDLQDMKGLFQGLSPFNEFFADVVSVAITQDPQSIANALHFANYAKINYEDRSFSIRTSKRPLGVEAHDLFSLSRNYIYKYYLSNPIYKVKGKAWLIRKTLESVACGVYTQPDVVVKMEADVKILIKKNPKMDVNKYFIEKLNDAFDVCIDKAFN